MTGPVTTCQSCGSPDLGLVVSLGQLPAVNAYHPIGARAEPEKFYPHELYRCAECELVQLGYVPSQREMFPVSYPYTSSTTRALRENFADLAREVSSLIDLTPEDLVVDIGGNDGNLLSNFVGKQRVVNVTPEDIGALGVERGIPHLQRYWGRSAATELRSDHGHAKLITATNVFAHVPDPNEFVEAALSVLAADGVFLTESHYLGAVIKGNQWDTIYGEHARYYSLASITNLLRRHGLVVPFARSIDSHGGSIRVYACRPDAAASIAARAEAHRQRFLPVDTFDEHDLAAFPARVAMSKWRLWQTLSEIKRLGGRIVGIGAPSRAATLINYVGIDHNVLDYICEIDGSHKIGSHVPGTQIPVVSEERLYRDSVDYALILSWHVASDMKRALRERGFKGKFVVPLPIAEVAQ